MIFDFGTRRFAAVTLGVTFLGGIAAGTLALNPAAAGIITAVTTVSCSVTGSNWCISGNNGSSGIGVVGTSKTGTGLRGTSTSQYGLKATSSSGTAILAQTTSGPAAINASGGKNGYGLTTTGFFGAYADGTLYGLYGTTPSGGGHGVGGIVTGSGTGVFGQSNSGLGVEALSTSNTALFASSGADGGGGTIATIESYNTSGSNSVAGYFNAAFVGVESQTPDNGYPYFAENGKGAVVFDVDGDGDIEYHGDLHHVLAVGRGAMKARSFGADSTRPTVEDTGTAQLASGAARVRLDPTFAASIETADGYRVFVTPNGDTHGLFVASKSPAGFIVRESEGGRSSVTFDYRIVATALGKAGQRMTFVNEAAIAPHVSPAAPRPARIPAVKTPAAEPPSP